jgi:hypothetical protein
MGNASRRLCRPSLTFYTLFVKIQSLHSRTPHKRRTGAHGVGTTRGSGPIVTIHQRFMTHVRILLILLVFAILPGCETPPSEVIDFTGSAPALRSTSVAPSSFNLSNQQMTGGVYQLSSTLSATVSDPQGVGDISQVQWAMYAPAGTIPIAQGTLSPIVSPAGSQTREYTSVASFQVSPSVPGAYRMEIVAVDASALRSTVASSTVRIGFNDLPPVLSLPGARLIAVQGTDSYRFTLTVYAEDASGLNDIAQVRVRALGSKDSSVVLMTDDGNRNSGDAVAGDGVFSATIWVVPTAAVQNVVFEFSATDQGGSASNTLRRSAENQPPQFLSLTVPSVIQRPASGTSSVLFYVSVGDANGPSDIDSVYFMNLSVSAPTPFLMFDDGDLTQHGDSLASDGTYSLILSISSTNSTGVKQFRFSAVDRAGARADTTRSITIN